MSRTAPTRNPFLEQHAKQRTLEVLGLLALLIFGGLLTGFYPAQPSGRPNFYGDVGVMTTDMEIDTLSKLIGGKKTFIFYFLPYCSHCADSAPAIARLAEKYSSQLQFIGISPGRSRLSDLTAFRKKFNLPFQIVQDSSSLFSQRNDLKGTPSYVLTDGSDAPPVTYSTFTEDMELILEIAILQYLGKDPLPLLDPSRYYGSQVCSTCHPEVYISWSLTPHAMAFRSLGTPEKQSDPKCLGCHTTAFKEKDGFQETRSTSWMADVGCEVCHGKAGGHNQKPSTGAQKATGKGTPEARFGPKCATCHETKHSPRFDLEKDIPLVRHLADRDIDQETWLARRAQLAKGESTARRPKLPAGKVLGADACTGCHKKEYTGWLSTKHRQSMADLKKEGNDQKVSCVKCHGTLTDGKAADALSSYVGGVQCEVCHGSGEAHVKAKGGKGNILALTSDSLSCVVGPLCTSCHDTENDPDFDLEQALSRITKSHLGEMD